MKVLIAIRDAVYARMLELEFSERGASCVIVPHIEETVAVFDDIRLAWSSSPVPREPNSSGASMVCRA